MRKTIQNNDVTNRKNVVDIENETELPCLIGLDAIYDENQAGHTRD